MTKLTVTSWDRLLVLAVILGGAGIRLASYGDLRLSIATLDTESYMRASQAPIISWSFFTGERLFTTNILYKFAGAGYCPVEVLSVPAIGREPHRKIQSCFEAMVLLQVGLSMLGWGLLIWAFSSALKKTLTRVAAVFVLSIFAFAPQIADWDSILSSEALTFSLFALALGLVIQVACMIRDGDEGRDLPKSQIVFGSAALVSLGLWGFTRDANIYTLAICCILTVPLIIQLRSRRAYLAAAGLVMFAICLLGWLSSMQSERWKIPLADAFDEYVIPIPGRVDIFRGLGMPEPDAAGFQAWFDAHAASTYAIFLVSHPGFVAGTLFDNVNALFANNNQPYFKVQDLAWRTFAVDLGDLVHSKSSSALLIDVLTVLALGAATITTGDRNLAMWTWLLFWLLASAAVTLMLTFFADPIGVERHVIFALMLFRLLLWLGLLVALDAISNRDFAASARGT